METYNIILILGARRGFVLNLVGYRFHIVTYFMCSFIFSNIFLLSNIFFANCMVLSPANKKIAKIVLYFERYFYASRDIFIFWKIFLNIFLADGMEDLASQEDGQPWIPSECLICIIQSRNAYFQNNFKKNGRPVKYIILFEKNGKGDVKLIVFSPPRIVFG